jgi:hypothetical protein
VTVPAGGSCVIRVTYAPGGSTATAIAHLSVTDTGVVAGGGAATQTSINFAAN